LLVAERVRVAPRMDGSRGQVIAGGRGIEKQLVSARSGVQMNLEKMRAQRASRR
jgi:hypothetical protein